MTKGSVNVLTPDSAAANHFQRPIADSVRVAILVLDPEGRVVTMNLCALGLTGYSREEITGRPSWFLLAPEDRRRMKGLCNSALKEGRRIAGVAAEVVTKDGARRKVALDIEAVRLGRKAVGAVVTATEISDSRNTEVPLGQNHERYRFLVETAADIIVTIDDQDTIFFANQAVQPVLGYTPSELVGKRITALIPRHARPPNGGRWSTYFEEKKKVWSWHGVFFPLLHKDGRVITVDLSLGKCNVNGRTVTTTIMRDVTARMRLEMTLRGNEQQMRLALQPGRTSVWDWDLRSNRITWYREVFETLGLEVAMVQSAQAHLGRVHPEDRARLQETVDRALDAKTEYQVEYRIASPKEENRWVEERGVGVYNGAGECVAVRGVICDVLDRKRVEAELRASEERYRLVVETQTDLICHYLPDTTLTFVNDAYCKYFSTRREDVVGKKFLQFIPPSSQPLILEHIQSLVENPTGPEGRLEHPILTPSGDFGWMHWINRVIVGADETVTELQGIGRDITERRRLEENLVRREQEFSSLVENLPDIISRLDSNLRFLYVSPNVTSLFGIPAERFVGRKPREVGVDSHDWAGFENACRQVFETGNAAYREFVWGDKCYRARIVPEPGRAGKVESVLCIDQDISEQKRIEGELRMLSSRLLDLQDAERRRISREMHDCTAQNLFAISMALSRLLQQTAVSNFRNTLEECLSLCEQSREEIRTLSYVLHPPMLDEAGLVPAMKWFVEGFSKRTGIKVDLVVSGKSGRLPMEIETDLFRVVQEALANIHRHSGSPAAVVRLDRFSTRILLQIRDWGRGMPAEIAQFSGAGLLGVGIAGMRERLAQLNGHLDIASSKQGTTITAVVPLTNVKAASSVRAASRSKSTL
jgi:PAS domain S-box-containing protein